MSKKTDFRTRQAPSPTGYLHIGTARIVLFTKLMAMLENGTYYLRIEDTDRQRLVPDAVQNLLSSLTELGLSPDEGVTLHKASPDQEPDSFYGVYQKGEYGPYIQSERKSLYQQKAQELINLGLAYWDYLEPEEVEEIKEMKKAIKKPIDYYQANLLKLEKLGWDEKQLRKRVKENFESSNPRPLRYKIQRNSKIKCQDLLVGESEFDLSLEEDFIILKSDGYPTYHLAHLVDDYAMKTTLVMRGVEWYASLPRHLQMFRDFYSYEFEPRYLHLPVILGETGNKKLSKRDADVDLQSYFEKGFLPEALVNYLAFLGWNPGTEKEFYL